MSRSVATGSQLLTPPFLQRMDDSDQRITQSLRDLMTKRASQYMILPGWWCQTVWALSRPLARGRARRVGGCVLVLARSDFVGCSHAKRFQENQSQAELQMCIDGMDIGQGQGVGTYHLLVSHSRIHDEQILSLCRTLDVPMRRYFSMSFTGSTLANHHGKRAGSSGHSP